MFENYEKGQEAVLKVQLQALKKGWAVCFPTMENRFDLILVDDNGKCHKIQVKYCGSEQGSEGATVVDFRKQTRNNGVTKRYNNREIDAVIAYLEEVDKLVWLGPEIFDGASTATIRHKPSKNGQKKGLNLLEDFVW